MRSFLAILLAAGLLQSQLAAGCHCQHRHGSDRCEAEPSGCEHASFFSDGDHHHDCGDHGASSLRHQPVPTPCDGCPTCSAADPDGLLIEAVSEVAGSSGIALWNAEPHVLASQLARRSANAVAIRPGPPQSLLSQGTLLRI
ncbi:hypothetical protein Pla108_40100 [Botrimarina colliarenosi]|uniref:Uncharacterized protein n=1 Tax=Botrimarina colliarenosi TaxID=2528001 RepID=A0A5C6A0M8_9BACT|nr:hypothetical protein [Botrimarina colliarenosi]TWT92870.1 hypothetical protein Pla108_40100 [Botrimarina colliarenosi]